jgi:hypothetical protein
MERRPANLLSIAPPWWQPMRWSAVSAVASYYRVACRIRSWGRLPARRGPTLIIANHQHEIESSVVVSDLTIRSLSWRYPIFTVSSRRMWEPGFLAERLPWLSPVLRPFNLGSLFSALGMQPIENELHTRPFVSLAYILCQLHADLPIAEVFRESAVEKLPPGIARLSELLESRHFMAGRRSVTLSEVREPYRKELLDHTRAQLETDIAHFEHLQRSGATIFLTPEGFYTGDGKMKRLRGILPRLGSLAQIWIVGISYDPFAGRRLSMLYRLSKAVPQIPLDVQLKRTRPITTSALLADWLLQAGAFSERDAIDAVRRRLAELPHDLFVDPELRRDPAAAVRAACRGMLALGFVRALGVRYELTEHRAHPEFPRTPDMVEYQSNFHAESLEGARYGTGDAQAAIDR